MKRLLACVLLSSTPAFAEPVLVNGLVCHEAQYVKRFLVLTRDNRLSVSLEKVNQEAGKVVCRVGTFYFREVKIVGEEQTQLGYLDIVEVQITRYPGPKGEVMYPPAGLPNYFMAKFQTGQRV